MKKFLPEGDTTTLLSGKAYFNEKEIALRLGMSVKWLQKMRLCGGGIPFYKIGGAIRYAGADILAFEARCKRGSTSSLDDSTSDSSE